MLEEPQFTSWRKLHDAVAAAKAKSAVVIVEGYTLLDSVHTRPALAALFDAVLWVSSTKAQVIARRTGYPSEAKDARRGWPARRKPSTAVGRSTWTLCRALPHLCRAVRITARCARRERARGDACHTPSERETG